MIPTPTPIILSVQTSDFSIPLSVWLVFALAFGLQGLLFYRRRKLALSIREAKKRGGQK